MIISLKGILNIKTKGIFIMSKQQMIEDLFSNVPENKLDIILAFIRFVLYESSEVDNFLLSEPSLSKDWLRGEEDVAWQDL